MPPPTAAQRHSSPPARPALVGRALRRRARRRPGLPVTRWSTARGDLRVPHFIGMHGLQLLPLAGLAARRRRRRDGRRADRRRAGAGYLGLVGATLVQALRGRRCWRPTR